ncbi:MAG: hypothetical protein KDB27_13285, partial [Planctomycetales bacterium]|nr:hypothetical protein [Planctomycetales bacterium]
MNSRVLFLLSVRRGFGHFMRCSNIADAIFATKPNAEVVFCLRGMIPTDFVDSRIKYFSSPDRFDAALIDQLLRRFRPELVVFDTMLPEPNVIPLLDSVKSVYIMRKCQRDKQLDILNSTTVRTFDSIVCPHASTEFGFKIPDDVLVKTTFVGPIVREPKPAETLAL